MTWRCPGASVTASSAAFAVSTQTIRRQSSGSRSAIPAALVDHGFHTTVVAEPVLSTSRRPGQHAILDDAATACADEHPVGLAGEAQGLGALPLARHAVDLVDVGGVLEPGDRHRAHVTDGQVGVQRGLERERLGRRVGHLERQAERLADAHAIAQLERVGPGGPARLVVLQPELDDHRAVGRGTVVHQPPGTGPSEAVHRRLGVGRVGAEPGEDERDTAPDRATRRPGRPVREEEDRGRSAGLEVGDRAALKIDVGLGARALDARALQTPGARLHDHGFHAPA